MSTARVFDRKAALARMTRRHGRVPQMPVTEHPISVNTGYSKDGRVVVNFGTAKIDTLFLTIEQAKSVVANIQREIDFLEAANVSQQQTT